MSNLDKQKEIESLKKFMGLHTAPIPLKIDGFKNFRKVINQYLDETRNNRDRQGLELRRRQIVDLILNVRELIDGADFKRSFTQSDIELLQNEIDFLELLDKRLINALSGFKDSNTVPSADEINQIKTILNSIQSQISEPGKKVATRKKEVNPFQTYLQINIDGKNKEEFAEELKKLFAHLIKGSGQKSGALYSALLDTKSLDKHLDKSVVFESMTAHFCPIGIYKGFVGYSKKETYNHTTKAILVEYTNTIKEIKSNLPKADIGSK